jgi:hypothetical protein
MFLISCVRGNCIRAVGVARAIPAEQLASSGENTAALNNALNLPLVFTTQSQVRSHRESITAPYGANSEE